MSRKIVAVGSVAALLFGSALYAQTQALEGTIDIEPEEDFNENGYVTSGGDAVRTGLGECLKLGSWAEENQVNPCEGIEEEPETAEMEMPEPEAEADAAPAPEPVEPEPIVTTATLGGETLFDTNSSELSAASEQALADLLSQLERFQEISMIEVVGHTDDRGPEEYNQTLSEERAASVQSFLQAAYPDVEISSSGMGESSPVATNSTPEGRQLNRRVEIQVTAKSISEPQS